VIVHNISLNQSHIGGSFARQQTNVATIKSVFYRVSGLDQGTSKKDVLRFVNQHHTRGDDIVQADIELMPAYNDLNKNTSMISVIKLSAE
jgi:hypothetical protein